MPYIIDTDAIAHIGNNHHNADEVYARLVQEVHVGNLFTVEQVFGELKKWPEIRQVFWAVRGPMKADQYHADVQAFVGYVAEQFPFLFDLTGDKNPDPADPWLIGCAKVFGYTLVTDERRTSTKRIPFVCRQQGVDVLCINGPDLIEALAHG